MPKFIVKKHLIHKGKIYEPGEEVALDDRKGAADLFNRGYIDATEAQPPPPPATPTPPAAPQQPPPPLNTGAPASGPAPSPEKPTSTKRVA